MFMIFKSCQKKKVEMFICLVYSDIVVTAIDFFHCIFGLSKGFWVQLYSENDLLEVFLCDLPNYYKSNNVKLLLADLLIKIFLTKNPNITKIKFLKLIQNLYKVLSSCDRNYEIIFKWQ